MSNKIQDIINEAKKVIIGKDETIGKIVMAILAGGHVLLEDVPGVGKTTMALTFSKVMGLEYKRVQFTPDVVPSDIVGFSLYDKEAKEFVYKPGAAMSNLLLADEINRTSTKTQSALLEVMEEGKVTIDGNTYSVPQPFTVIATQNPVGSLGTQMLPQSQLDRFMVKLHMGYPDYQSQINILRDRQSEQPLDLVKQVVTKDEIMSMKNEITNIYISDAILEYIALLAEETRKHDAIQLGISPRGALAISRMAKAKTYVEGRDYVTPEDVIGVFSDVGIHRIMLHPKTKISNITEKEVLDEIIKNIVIPTIKEEMSELKG